MAVLQSEVWRDDSDLSILLQNNKHVNWLDQSIHDETRAAVALNGIGQKSVEQFVPKEDIFIGNTCGLLEWKPWPRGSSVVEQSYEEHLVDTPKAQANAEEIVNV